MRSAPLDYKGADVFMRRAGYNQAYGKRFFKYHHVDSPWGVDDLAFLEQVADFLPPATSKPFFLTLLTVGTHHPYNVPKAYQGKTQSKFGDSLLYLDKAISVFIKKLKEKNILDNTLLLITSDESPGNEYSNSYRSQLSRSWIPLIVMDGQLSREPNYDLFLQSDIPASILDYLNVPIPRGLKGRSLFRDYDKGREVFFSNIYERRFYQVNENGQPTICNHELTNCMRSETSLTDETAFFPTESLVRVDGYQAIIRDVIAFNDIKYKHMKLLFDDLLTQPYTLKTRGGGQKYKIGMLDLKKSTSYEVIVQAATLAGETEIYVEAIGEGDELRFKSSDLLLKNGAQKAILKIPPLLAPGIYTLNLINVQDAPTKANIEIQSIRLLERYIPEAKTEP
jgi:hypothetical protein